jgi:hypothetical protein
MWLVLASLLACSSEPTDETPRGALKMFLAAMERSDYDEAALVDAYRLLDAEARAELDARAASANALPGPDREPWQMLAQGRFQLRFEPRPDFEENIDGDRANVIVRGYREGERADIPMIREGEHWRVVLRLEGER